MNERTNDLVTTAATTANLAGLATTAARLLVATTAFHFHGVVHLMGLDYNV